MNDLPAPEEWRPVIGYEFTYHVSDLGRLKSLQRIIIRKNGQTQKVRERILKVKPAKDGRMYAHLTVGGRGRTLAVHRLVALAFIGHPERGQELCHNDGNPSNNVVTNLRWDTSKGNKADMILHGTRITGAKNHQTKLTEDQVHEIKYRFSKGDGNIALGREFDVSAGTIWAIRNGKSWRHVA